MKRQKGLSVQLLLLKWLINALAILSAVKLIDGIHFSGPWWHMIIIGALFGLVNSVIRPVVKVITYPVILVTLGLFTLCINAAMFCVTALISRELNLGLVISGSWPALWGALTLSIVSFLLSVLSGRKKLEKGEA